VGRTEVLFGESWRCVERARAAGVSAEVEVWRQMPHGWQAMPFLPESDRAIERMGDFIRSSCP
jgi:epsilon-lactone hydrolase